MPKLFIICGPCDSGNRLMATAFVAAGCAGEASNAQPPLVSLVAGGRDAVFVNHWLTDETLAVARAAKYEPCVVVMARDWFCMAHGQVWRGHVKGVDWRKVMTDYIPSSIRFVFQQIEKHGLRYCQVQYESLATRYRQVARWVCEFFDVVLSADFAVGDINKHPMTGTFNANDRWYEGEGALYLLGFDGLGDNVYQRPFVRAACKQCPEVYLRTSWPQLYWDIMTDYGLKVVASRTSLRTQAHNVLQYKSEFVEPPIAAKEVHLRYTLPDFKAGHSIMETFGGIVSLDGEPFDFSLPVMPEWAEAAERIVELSGIPRNRFALIFPPTVRTEWKNEARNCEPEAMATASKWLADAGYCRVRIGWVEKDVEWYDGGPPEADVCWDNGRLNVQLIAAMMRMAAVNVTSVKFALPLGLATSARLCVLMGGCYPRELLTDPWMDLSRCCLVGPEPFCGCLKHFHDCNKKIEPECIVGALRELTGSV